MLCVLEIASLVFGIMTLVKGTFSVGKNKEVRGPAAYVVALLLLSVLPVAIVLAILLNWDDLQNGGGPQPFQFNLKSVLPDLIAVVGCGGAAMVVAFATAKPKRKKRRRRRVGDYDDYEDDYNDRPIRRRRDEIRDEEDDDRPIRRRRTADEDDDDRPRRRRDDLDDRAR